MASSATTAGPKKPEMKLKSKALLSVLALGEIWIAIGAGVTLQRYMNDSFPQGSSKRHFSADEKMAMLRNPPQTEMAIGFFVGILAFMVHLRTMTWVLPIFWNGKVNMESWLKARINLVFLSTAVTVTIGIYGSSRDTSLLTWILMYLIWTCVAMWGAITIWNGKVERLQKEVFVGIVVPSDCCVKGSVADKGKPLALSIDQKLWKV